jgi:hypothetical protein
MNRPSGVRAAETMTTGSESLAMAVILKQAGASLNYNNHMMHRGMQCGHPMTNCRDRMKSGYAGTRG